MKVSVVIPLYDAQDVTRETIGTVLAQTWKDYEIIVVDDGSTEGNPGGLIHWEHYKTLDRWYEIQFGGFNQIGQGSALT
jgi:hypothetical protein